MSKQAQETVVVPREPTEGVLLNMAIRYDHGLGCPGYYDHPMFGEPGHARRLEAAKVTMRQLYEEVVLSTPVSPDSDLLKEAVGLLRGLVETPAADYDAAAEADQIRAFLSRVEERGHD